MGKLKEFLDRALEVWAAGSIYVLGAQGQDRSQITEAWIIHREHNKKAKYKVAIDSWKKRLKKDDKNFWAYDCSGLLVDWLMENGYLPQDYNANGLKGFCNWIDKKDMRPGCVVFRVNDDDNDGNDPGDRAHHVGICTDYNEDGELMVTEAMGRSQGIVRRSINSKTSKGPYWELFGYFKFFKNEIFSDSNVGGTYEESEEDELIVYCFQKAADAAGYNMLKEGKKWLDIVTKKNNGCDNEKGAWTKNVMHEIQAKHGLPESDDIDAKLMDAVISEAKAVDPAEMKALQEQIDAAQVERAGMVSDFADIKAKAGKWA